MVPKKNIFEMEIGELNDCVKLYNESENCVNPFAHGEGQCILEKINQLNDQINVTWGSIADKVINSIHTINLDFSLKSDPVFLKY